MSDKEELLMMDFYETLNISMKATEKEIKKSYRKVALKCHPDKNPDNPKAAAEFNRLQKIFEILSDPIEKLKYDKLLKGRKLAAIRARERSSHSRKLKDDLDRREREAAQAKNKLSDSEKQAREIERLKEEGDRLMREENEKMERELRESKKRAASRLTEELPEVKTTQNGSYKVKVKWVAVAEHIYDKEQIHNLFYKWGELNAVVIKLKGQKGTALVDYKDKSGADMAVQFERGLESCPLTVTALESKTENVPSTDPTPQNSFPQSNGEAKRDYESVADMHKRRKNERARLMQEMLRNDGVED